MGEVFFYHLTHSPLEATLGELLEKSRARGWRALVRSDDPALLERLDGQLWLRGEGSFLAHGRAGGAHDADQPVLLTGEGGNANGAQILFLVAGAASEPDEADRFERVCVMFDGNDPGAVEAARRQWTALSGQGHALRYWSQAGGAWRQER